MVILVALSFVLLNAVFSYAGPFNESFSYKESRLNFCVISPAVYRKLIVATPVDDENMFLKSAQLQLNDSPLSVNQLHTEDASARWAPGSDPNSSSWDILERKIFYDGKFFGDFNLHLIHIIIFHTKLEQESRELRSKIPRFKEIYDKFCLECDQLRGFRRQLVDLVRHAYIIPDQRLHTSFSWLLDLDNILSRTYIYHSSNNTMEFALDLEYQTDYAHNYTLDYVDPNYFGNLERKMQNEIDAFAQQAADTKLSSARCMKSLTDLQNFLFEIEPFLTKK